MEDDTSLPTPDAELAALIAALPEVYQPIHGYATGRSSRDRESARTRAIHETVAAVADRLGRHLEILDLGTAQGFYAFGLAERGHRVLGVDYLAANVAVCDALAARHPDLDVRFRVADVSDVAEIVIGHRFDLVLGLSVLHHVAHRDGAHSARRLVGHLRDHVDHAIFEMALRAEPVYWAPSLPEDPRITLAPYPFMRVIADSPTHLSDVRRPVLYASATHALVDGHLEPIRTWSEHPHARASALAGRRRYFTIDGAIVKVNARFDDGADAGSLSVLADEMRAERDVLRELAAVGAQVPAVLDFSDRPDEVVVCRELLPGRLLDDLTDADLDREAVFGATLAALADLEDHGWYHADLRAWNVLWDDDSGVASLIDYGTMRRDPGDVVWPGDSRLSLMMLCLAWFNAVPDQVGIEVPRVVTPSWHPLPGRARAVVSALLQGDDRRTTFRALSDLFHGLDAESAEQWSLTAEPFGLRWLRDHGELIVEQRRDSKHQRSVLQERVADLELELAHLRPHARHVEDRMERAERELEVLRAERAAVLSVHESVRVERDALEQLVRRLEALQPGPS